LNNELNRTSIKATSANSEKLKPLIRHKDRGFVHILL